MTGRLKGKVAIITGGSSGMGRATVDLFLQEGAKVVCGDVQDERGELMIAELGKENFSYIHCNVASESDVKGMVNHAVSKFGRLDVMFNNAGIGGVGGKVSTIDMAGFDETVDVLIGGVVLGFKYASPIMIEQKSGSIISTASPAGVYAGFGPMIYSACKAAVINLSRCASIPLARHSVRSNTINPGNIATQIFTRGYDFPPAAADKFAIEMRKHLADNIPFPRAGIPEDIANMALFFASDESEYVTGQSVMVDGGLTAGQAKTLGQKIDFNKILADFVATLPEHEKPKGLKI